MIMMMIDDSKSFLSNLIGFVYVMYKSAMCGSLTSFLKDKKNSIFKKNANRKMDGNYEHILIAALWDAILYIYRLKQNHGTATTKFRMEKIHKHGKYLLLLLKKQKTSL